jgi:hypothetical protein
VVSVRLAIRIFNDHGRRAAQQVFTIASGESADVVNRLRGVLKSTRSKSGPSLVPGWCAHHAALHTGDGDGQ